MKTVDLYGVLVTPIQEMSFMKFINENGIAMNTKTKEQRMRLVEDFINHPFILAK